jgi:hypothetical protein
MFTTLGWSDVLGHPYEYRKYSLVRLGTCMQAVELLGSTSNQIAPAYKALSLFYR